MAITSTDIGINYLSAPYLPYGRVKVDSARSTFAVSLAEAKAHLRIDSSYTTDDTYITTLTKIAQNIVEKETGILLTSLVMTYIADEFNTEKIDLGFNGNTLTHVKYYDTDNSLQTLASSQYDVSNLNYPNANVLIYPAKDADWPDTYDKPDAVEIKFTAGLNQTYNIPEGLIQAILLIIGRYYEIRQDVVTGTIAVAIPLAAEHLINQYKEATIV
tara:strand:+ start:383 stop:1030 length:648 start_codon:yes stop_codon:yes gene_type:complete